MNEHLILLSEAEYALRLGRLQQAMEPAADALLLCDNANLYWLTGRVFAGYAYPPKVRRCSVCADACILRLPAPSRSAKSRTSLPAWPPSAPLRPA